MNRTEVLELRRKRANLIEQARGVLAEANGNLTVELNEKYERIMADVDGMKRTIDAEERQASLEADLEESTRQPNRPETPEARDENPTRSVVLAGDEYAAAFRNWLAIGETQEERNMIQLYRPNTDAGMAVRAQGVGSAGAGGATVPTGFRAQLFEAMKAFGGVRSTRATVISTEAGNDLPIPTVNDTGNTGELVAENTEVSAQDVTFSSVTLKAYKYSSKTVLVSFELLQDSAIDITRYVAQALGTRLGRITNTHFTTGDNSSKPQGIVNASTLGKSAASATAITYLELIDLIHSVDPAHRRNAEFMFNDVVLQAMKKLQDGEGRPLWLPGVALNEPDRILGRPYTINQDMAAIATGNKTVLFGDFSYFHIREVMDIALYRIVDKYIEQGSVGFLAYMRTDSKHVNPGSNPIKHLIQA